MKIKYGRPWFAFLLRMFGMAPKDTAIYTFGDTIYTPGPLTMDLVAHEETHSKQQAGFLGALRWWIRYLTDKEFRLEQEVQAYVAQMRYLRDRVPRRIALRSLYAMSEVLSSPMYGFSMTEAQAMACIQDRVRLLDHEPKNESIKATSKKNPKVVATAATTSSITRIQE